MKVESDLMRGAGPVAVLKLLERKAMYGYELTQALDRDSSGILAMGQSTLYPLLYNLEAKGLVESSWEHASGRDRKYYRLTGKGKERLATDMQQWSRLLGAMQALGIAERPSSTSPAPLMA